MDVISLTKKLIKIPSYREKNVNEKLLGNFICEYLSKFPWLTVQKQWVDKNRFNVIATDGFPTKVIICDHIDTVQPQQGWRLDPFSATVERNKIYGLGASDSKGNVAVVLDTVRETGPTKGLLVLLYVDEEYDFRGMRQFIKRYKRKLSPRIIASADGDNLEVGAACRGLIEIAFKVKGNAGHSANPESGRNAISGSFKAIGQLEKWLSKKANKILGKNTLNLAWVKGGQSRLDTDDLGKEGNIIPDFAEFVLEIRVADPSLNAKRVVKALRDYLMQEKLNLVSYSIRHDYGSWITNKKDVLRNIRFERQPAFTQARKRGYVDLQMLWEEFNKPICFTFGVGEKGLAHKPNEYVEIDKLIKGTIFWKKFLKSVCPND